MNKYTELRNEARTFFSDDAVGPCKGVEQQASFQAITQRLNTIADTHPEYDAMRMRREYYHILTEEFQPKLFLEAPFYFAAGINGGWANSPGAWFLKHFTKPVMSHNVPEEDRLKHDLRQSQRFILCCGSFVDQVHHLPPFTRILKDGFSGVYRDVLNALKDCSDPEKCVFLETAAEGLLSLRKIQLKFRDKARELAQNPSLTLKQKKFMSMAAEGADRCPWEPPQTFFEGLNLLLFVREILALMDTLYTYSLGHPDAMLNGLYEADLEAGRVSKEEAFDLICRFLIISDCHYDGDKKVSLYSDHELEQPIAIGGCDKNGENIFNDITRFILRGHRENDLVFPKVHCRFRADAPREYLHEIALDVWNGRCVYTLFNDATIIPGLMKRGKTLLEARAYLCAGCWNGSLDSMENVDDANYYSLARVLEAMIYQDEEMEKQLHFSFDSLDDCHSADEVRDTVCRNLVAFMRDFLSNYTQYGQFFAEISPHPLYSACLDGCIESGRDDTRGGARFNSRVIVLAFLANVVDSILAIKRICFEKKICSLPDFLDVVRRNWAGAEALRQEAMRAPYWGDGHPESMAMGKQLLEQLRSGAEGLKNERGGDYCFAIWIYREFRYWGEKMRALPDGRHDGDYLAQALNPSEFRNHGEITTTLNALSCLDYTDFHSSNINLTFDQENITPDTLEAVFRSFGEKKLQIMQPNCFSRADLEDACIHPEKHRNLIVKVCGFSARFVALDSKWQQAVMARYRY